MGRKFIKSNRLSAKPSSEALIKTRPGEKCVYFGDVPTSKDFTAICKNDQMDEALKSLCGNRAYSVLRIKELVNNELAVRVRMEDLKKETLIS